MEAWFGEDFGGRCFGRKCVVSFSLFFFSVRFSFVFYLGVRFSVFLVFIVDSFGILFIFAFVRG